MMQSKGQELDIQDLGFLMGLVETFIKEKTVLLNIGEVRWGQSINFAKELDKKLTKMAGQQV